MGGTLPKPENKGGQKLKELELISNITTKNVIRKRGITPLLACKPYWFVSSTVLRASLNVAFSKEQIFLHLLYYQVIFCKILNKQLSSKIFNAF